jgi:hypothetical protein
MKCDYCNGVGSYDPFTGPTTECPKCKGTGHVGKVGSADAPHGFDECKDQECPSPYHLAPNPDGTYGVPASKQLADTYAEERKEAAQRARVRNVAFQKKAKVATDALIGKDVEVYFHPGLNRTARAGIVEEVESFGPHIQSIKLDIGTRSPLDIGMQDVERIVNGRTGDELWPTSKFATGGVVDPKDKRFRTDQVPAGTPVYYDRKTGLWTTDKDSCGDPAAQAHIFGAKLTLGSDPWVDRNDEVDDYIRLEAKDWFDKQADALGITRQELRQVSFALAYGRPRGLGPKSYKIEVPEGKLDWPVPFITPRQALDDV